MSRSVAHRADKAPRASQRSRASARLGQTLRSVLLSPTDGFAAAVKATERRARAGRRPIEGLSSYVLTALGGASLASLWLKAGALFKLRQVCTDQYIATYIAATLLLGALIALLAQALWGTLGSMVLPALRGGASRAELRLIWGASALPQVFVLVVLLPLDLLLVGTGSFTTQPLQESLATAWAALSISLAVSVAIWSLFLFFKGIQVVGQLSRGRAVLGMLVAAACLGVVIAAGVFGVSFVAKEATCPTRLA